MVDVAGEIGARWTKRLLNRGITLLSHIMKLLERILDKRLRERVEHELGEEQQGFRKGRVTTDGMFSKLVTGKVFLSEHAFPSKF